MRVRTLQKRVDWVPLLVFVMALAVRAGYMLFYVGVDTPLQGDEPEYQGYAVSFLQGEGWHNGPRYSTRAPLTSMLLVAVYRAAGIDTRAGRWAMVVVSAMAAPAVFVLGRQLYGDRWRVPLMASLCWVFYPPSIFYAGMIITENLAALLIVLGVAAFVWSARSGRIIPAACAGLVWAGGALNRPIALFVPLAFLVGQLLAGKKNPWRWTRRQWLVGLVVFVAAMAPWTIRNYRIHHVFMPATSYGGIMISSANANLDNPVVQAGSYYHDPRIRGYIQSQPEALWNSIGLEIAWDQVRQNVGPFLHAVVNRAKNFWTPRPDPYDPFWTANDWLMTAVWLPVLVLFAASFRWLPWRQDWPSLAMVLYAFVLTLPFWGTPRFRYPVDPLILLRAVSGLAGIALWRRKRLEARGAWEVGSPEDR
jgi:4-amino-4-deoxy-L-arabinose transferase-like glycosyltransferase